MNYTHHPLGSLRDVKLLQADGEVLFSTAALAYLKDEM
jgi:hypothetical protein